MHSPWPAANSWTSAAAPFLAWSSGPAMAVRAWPLWNHHRPLWLPCDKLPFQATPETLVAVEPPAKSLLFLNVLVGLVENPLMSQKVKAKRSNPIAVKNPPGKTHHKSPALLKQLANPRGSDLNLEKIGGLEVWRFGDTQIQANGFQTTHWGIYIYICV